MWMINISNFLHDIINHFCIRYRTIGWTGWKRVRLVDKQPTPQPKYESDSDTVGVSVDIHPLIFEGDEDTYYGSIEWLYDV